LLKGLRRLKIDAVTFSSSFSVPLEGMKRRYTYFMVFKLKVKEKNAIDGEKPKDQTP